MSKTCKVCAVVDSVRVCLEHGQRWLYPTYTYILGNMRYVFRSELAHAPGDVLTGQMHWLTVNREKPWQVLRES